MLNSHWTCQVTFIIQQHATKHDLVKSCEYKIIEHVWHDGRFIKVQCGRTQSKQCSTSEGEQSIVRRRVDMVYFTLMSITFWGHLSNLSSVSLPIPPVFIINQVISWTWHFIFHYKFMTLHEFNFQHNYWKGIKIRKHFHVDFCLIVFDSWNCLRF